jgi:hypothetical protein
LSDGVEAEDSLASETTSSSTVGLGGGGPLRGPRLRLRSRVSYSEALRKEDAAGAELSIR